MVYCFSGTGNSQWVADKLQGLTSGSADVYGLVFPVYAWGIPKIVSDYVREHADDIRKAEYVYAVMTCGDDMGYADKLLRKALGGRLNAAFSVQMPNTYVCLPGFDVDKDDVAKGKVEKALTRLPEIAGYIKRRERKTDVVRGRGAWMKSYVLRPLFNRFLMTDKYFHVDSNLCTHCRLCVKGCPLGNMTTDEKGNIIWKHHNCTACLRCYHRCPTKAVQFGRFTKNKGQKKQLEGSPSLKTHKTT